MSPSRDRNRSGEALATSTPCVGEAHHRGVGRGVALGQGGTEGGDVGTAPGPVPRAAAPAAGGSGSPGTRRPPRSRRGSADAGGEAPLGRGWRSRRRGPGPPREARARAVAGRTVAKRAHTGSPANGITTAQNPAESSAARSEVTSTRSVHSRPPTTASGAAAGRGRCGRWAAARRVTAARILRRRAAPGGGRCRGRSAPRACQWPAATVALVARGEQLRRTWPQRLLLGFNVAAGRRLPRRGRAGSTRSHDHGAAVGRDRRHRLADGGRRSTSASPATS